jgi:replicative DNA helicase
VLDTFDESSGGTSPDLRKTRRKKTAMADLTKIDRLPPHSMEAEQGVLGCILLSPNDCLGDCIEKFKSGSEVFYDLRHRSVYETLIEMYERKEAIDLITVQQTLKDKSQLDGVGGLAYLASLPDAVPSAANLEYYLEIVREKFVLRRMISTCTEVVSRAYEHQGHRSRDGGQSHHQGPGAFSDSYHRGVSSTPGQARRARQRISRSG